MYDDPSLSERRAVRWLPWAPARVRTRTFCAHVVGSRMLFFLQRFVLPRLLSLSWMAAPSRHVDRRAAWENSTSCVTFATSVLNTLVSPAETQLRSRVGTPPRTLHRRRLRPQARRASASFFPRPYLQKRPLPPTREPPLPIPYLRLSIALNPPDRLYFT